MRQKYYIKLGVSKMAQHEDLSFSHSTQIKSWVSPCTL